MCKCNSRCTMPNSPRKFASESLQDSQDVDRAGILVEDSSHYEARASGYECSVDRSAPVVIESSNDDKPSRVTGFAAASSAIDPDVTCVPSSQDDDSRSTSDVPHGATQSSGEAATIVQAVTMLRVPIAANIADDTADRMSPDDVVLSSQGVDIPVMSTTNASKAAAAAAASTSQHLANLHLSGACFVADTCETNDLENVRSSYLRAAATDDTASAAGACDPSAVAEGSLLTVIPASLTPGHSQSQAYCGRSSGEDDKDDPYQMLKNTQALDATAEASPTADAGLAAVASRRAIAVSPQRFQGVSQPPLDNSGISVCSFKLFKPGAVDTSVKKVKEWQHIYCAPHGGTPGLSSSSDSPPPPLLPPLAAEPYGATSSVQRTLATVFATTNVMPSSMHQQMETGAVSTDATFREGLRRHPLDDKLSLSPVKSQDLCDEMADELQPLQTFGANTDTQAVMLHCSPTQREASQTQLSVDDSVSSCALRIDLSGAVPDDAGDRNIEAGERLSVPPASSQSAAAFESQAETSSCRTTKPREQYVTADTPNDSCYQQPTQPDPEETQRLCLFDRPDDATVSGIISLPLETAVAAVAAVPSVGVTLRGSPIEHQSTQDVVRLSKPLKSTGTALSLTAERSEAESVPAAAGRQSSTAAVHLSPADPSRHAADVLVCQNDDDTEVFSCSEGSTASDVVVLRSSQPSVLVGDSVRTSPTPAVSSLHTVRSGMSISYADTVRLFSDFASQSFCKEMFSRYLQRTQPAVTPDKLREKAQKLIDYAVKHEEAIEASDSTSSGTTMSTGYSADVSSLSKTTSTSSTSSASTGNVASVEMHSESITVQSTKMRSVRRIRPEVSAKQLLAEEVTNMPAPQQRPPEPLGRRSLSSTHRGKVAGRTAACASLAAASPDGSSSSTSDPAGASSAGATAPAAAAAAVPAAALSASAGSSSSPPPLQLQLPDLSPVANVRSSGASPGQLLHSTDGNSSSSSGGLRQHDSAEKHSPCSADLFASIDDNSASVGTSRGPVTPDAPVEHRSGKICAPSRRRSSGRISSGSPQSFLAQPSLQIDEQPGPSRQQADAHTTARSADKFIELPPLNIWERPIRASPKRPLVSGSLERHRKVQRLVGVAQAAAAPGDRSSKTFGVTANVSTVATAVPLESAQQPVAAIRSALRTGIHSDAAQAAPPSLVGRKVMAKWTDKRFYPGRIAGVRGKRLNISFDDGTQLCVAECDVVVVTVLPVGQPVCVRLPDGYYVAGRVAEQAPLCVTAGSSSDHMVTLGEEGTTLRFKWYQLSMDAEQIAELRRRLSAESSSDRSDSRSSAEPSRRPVTTAETTAEAPGSLQKSKASAKRKRAEGKGLGKKPEKRRKTVVGSEPAKPAASTEVIPSSSAAATARSSATAVAALAAAAASASAVTPATPPSAAPKGARRKRPSLQRTSTPAHRRRKNKSPSSSSPVISSLFPDVRESPRRPARSATGKSVKHGLFADDVKGPVAAAGSTFFKGCSFLLTHVRKSETVSRKERRLMIGQRIAAAAGVNDDDSRSESADEDDASPGAYPSVPFDKEQLVAQIESAGGVVLEAFSLEASAAAARGVCFLISDMFQRTLKYLQCLAAGVPCVANVWIRDCCRAGQRLDYRPYRLPAGLCIQTSSLLEYSGCTGVFCGQRVFVSPEGSHKAFVDEWTSVLTLAGATVMSKWPSAAGVGPLFASGTVSQHVTVIVDASVQATPFIAKKVAMSLEPALLATTEWVIQCLIQGSLLPLDAHPKFTQSSKSPGRRAAS